MQYYKYGYAGSPNRLHKFNQLVTNKFFEYLACGCLPIMYETAEMERILIEDYGCKLVDIGLQGMRSPESIPTDKSIYFESEHDKLDGVYSY